MLLARWKEYILEQWKDNPQNETILSKTIVNHLGEETTSNFHLKKMSQSLLSILWGSILSSAHTETVESNIHLYLIEA